MGQNPNSDPFPTMSTHTLAEPEAQNLTGKYLTFRIGEESFGVDVLKIREIIRMQKITPVPQMPTHVRGVINLRGKVIPVFDLRAKFNLPPGEADSRNCIVVVQAQSAATTVIVGLIVDAVEEVINIQQNQCEPAPDMGGGLNNGYVLCLAKIKSEVKTLLAIDKVILDTGMGGF